MRNMCLIFSLLISFYINAQNNLIDTDGDGVPDIEDSCPTIPGPKENKGCEWEMIVCYSEFIVSYKKEQTKLDQSQINNINAVIDILKKQDFHFLTLKSYTHFDRNTEFLEKIAIERVEFIKKYLISQGIDENKIKLELLLFQNLKYPECQFENCNIDKINQENYISFFLETSL